ncbi:prepilin-type N-terminal cleavage/methylation domain-containing protein [Methylomagnum sp.]
MESGKRQRAKWRQRGFTLLEMLVVLVLTGLIAGILFQGLGQVFRLQNHFGVELDNMRQNAMFADWFRQVIEGVQPDYPDGKHKFTGSERRIAGLTTNPLKGMPGALAPFVLELRFDARTGETQLMYGEGEAATALFGWPGDKGRFVFLDADQVEHDRWPPPMSNKPMPRPVAVRLDGERDGRPWLLVAAPMGPDQSRLRVRDILSNKP